MPFNGTLSRTASLSLTAGATGGAGGAGAPFSIALPGPTIFTTYDALVRLFGYVRNAEENARRFLTQLDAGGDHMDLRRQAIEARNTTLTQFRGRITPFGRAFSEALKEEGRSIEDLVHYYYTNPRTGLGNPANMARVVRASELHGADLFRAAGRSVVAANRARQTNPLLWDVEAAQPTDAFWGVARRQMLFERLHAFCHASSETVSRLIVSASGRTNQTINIIAKVSAGVGVGVIISCGVVSVLWFGFDRVPREVANWLTFPSVESAVRSSTMAVGSLATGLIARGAGHCVRSFPTWARVTGVTVTHIIFLGLLLFVFEMYFAPMLR